MQLKSKPGPKSDLSTEISSQHDDDIKEYEVNNFKEYIDVIQEILSRGFTFYRGDKSGNKYFLVPSLYKSDNSKIVNREDDMIDEFTSLAVNKQKYTTDRFIEEMLMAQHYELPTRLQDWTESALTSLYFAVHTKPKEERVDGSIVWALNPSLLNKHLGFIKENKLVPNIIGNSLEREFHETIEKYYIKNETPETDLYPIALKARKINPRIEAQRGVFVLFPKAAPNKCKSLTEYKGANEFLIRINISKDISSILFSQLQLLGINQFLLFPELKSIADDIVSRYKIQGV